MTATQLTFPCVESARAESRPPLPAGWRLETYTAIGDRVFTRAVDPDGCRWYNIDGRWTLNVPWFRRSPGLPPDRCDDLAVVETVDGNRAYPINEAGTILIGRRRIPSQSWDH